MIQLKSTVILCFLPIAIAACRSGTYANSAEGVTQFAQDVRGNYDLLIASLPTPAETVLICNTPEDATKLDAYVEQMRSSLPDGGIDGKPEQTAVLVTSATTDALQAGTDQELAGGYSKTASRYRKGLTFYSFKYVEPGDSLGMRFDGVTHVGGRLVFLPKMWRAFN